ncbi:helix-turn-helix domain-containing protein [Runella sp.]|uniref:helix-turn-helix domain-containing protein n=1 Tax=Runella sp. TaxID=1960881 RepID=UPI003D0AD8D4
MLTVTLGRYSDLQHNELAIRQLTGLKSDEFDLLHCFFESDLTDYFAQYTLEGTPRNRKVFFRKNTIFADTQDALLFVLIYLKGHVRQEQLALFFGIDQPKVSKYIKFLRRILFQVIKAYPEAISRYKKERILNNRNKNDKSRISYRYISENRL